MPSPLVPADNIAAALTKLDDGDRLKSSLLTPTIQGIANREEAIRLALVHAATAQLLTTLRDTTDGFKRARFLTSAAALSALVVGAGNDREIALINDGTSNLMYVYDHGNATGVDGVFVLSSAGGRWLLLNSGAKGTTPGYPFTDAAGKLTGPIKIKGAIKEYTDFSVDGAAVALVNQGTNNIAGFVDPLATAILAIPNCEIGDVIDVRLLMTCQLASANPGARGIFRLRFGPAAGPFLDGPNSIIGPFNNSGNFLPLYLAGRFVVTVAGTNTIRPQLQTNGVGGTTVNLFSPLHGRAQRIEP